MIRRLLTTLILCVFAFTAFITFAEVASAAPPGISDCKDAPTPQMPGRGFSGSIDSGPTHIDPNATSVYETVQYPPPWHTYDLGCGGGARDPSAVLDTTIGNWIKGVATSLVALGNSIHRFVSPPTFLGKLNPLLVKGTGALRTALYNPWVNLSLLVLAVVIIVSARRQNLPTAVEMVVWAFMIMGLVTVLFSYPVQAGHMADDLATSTVGQVNASMLGEPASGQDPSSARAAVLTENVLYKQWLMGELGSADSTVAKKYGRLLLAAQTYTYAEAQVIKHSGGSLIANLITSSKKDNFKTIAAKIETEDPDAYSHLKGQEGSRIGIAALSLAAAVITTPFMILADFLVVFGLLIIRLAIIIAPAVAPIAIHHKMRSIAISLGKIVAAALVNTIVFAVGAAINALAVGVMLGGDTGLPMWANLLICLAISMILWGALKPFRKLTSMVSSSQITQGAVNGITMPNARKSLRQVAGVAAGVWAGAAVAGLATDDDKSTEELTPNTPRTESWSRTATPSSGIRDITNERVVPRYESPPPPLAAIGVATPTTQQSSASTQTTPVLALTPAPAPTSSNATPADVKPAPPGTPEITAPVAKHVVPQSKPDIYPANQPLPTNIVRADPIMQNGTLVYRIWDADTKAFVTVNELNSEETRDA